ncbi:hypothetical protein HELRODRAFT_193530 [Helobdella robusta]|uniref:Peptidase S1 domain-containing protein n=1 Tax=Helobdella robusta TaxID=6412 RepID=T1FV33_HELRO|nr:hypothetical protein HELRODRAFT_193530 [Helobdella robusta]ESN95517.1 hypothetical protein HELRODRAFT_193530 [Helobdella robusta]
MYLKLQIQPNQFKCQKLKVCVPNEFRCNGLSECSDLSDEKNCLSINEYGLLTSVYQNQSGYLICSDGWLNEHSDAACRNMGYSRSIRFNAVYQNSAKSLRNFEGKFADGTDFLANFKPSSNCPSNRYVELSCYTQECGKRDASFDLKDTYIRNGFIAKDSAWPWQIQMYKNIIDINETLFSCGGTILSERWILTAAHCLFRGDELWQNSAYRIQVGTNRLFDKRFKELTVDEVKLFQYNSSVAANDIALIKLSEPLTFNKTVQPICLAQPNIVEAYDVCVVTGHGKTDPADGISSSKLLLQGKMNVMTHSECLASYVEILQRSENEFNVTYEKQFCAGLMPAFIGIRPMEGDSGGPLMCRNSRFQWTQIGVVSYGDDSKIDYCPISVFTRVSYYYKALMDAMK